MYQYMAEVVRWVDGDTVDLRVDLGFRISLEERFRLYDPTRYVDTPERGEANYDAARECSERVYPAGTKITVQTYKKDKYGRWLAHIPEVIGALESAGYLKPTKA